MTPDPVISAPRFLDAAQGILSERRMIFEIGHAGDEIYQLNPINPFFCEKSSINASSIMDHADS
ncbi:hypothetical protein [Luethyella okanaganae]|uniref:Uncharacterized protein n=1 Tax=Luethyella okanaganae TaxID=69372 RepID=A0ABW1VJB9_9MICO